MFLMRLKLMVLVVSLVVPGVASAQGLFASINAGRQLASNDFAHEFSAPSFLTRVVTDYPIGNGGIFDVGGGLQIADDLWLGVDHLGIGASFSVAAAAHDAALSVQLPSPLAGGDSVRFSGSQPLDRWEKSLHLRVIGALSVSDRLTLAAYGGPSFVSVTQDIVNDFDVPPVGDFSITATEVEALHASEWGFNAGIDLAFYFSEQIGVGGGAQFTKATVNFENLIVNTAADEQVLVASRTGGVQILVGLRLRSP